MTWKPEYVSASTGLADLASRRSPGTTSTGTVLGAGGSRAARASSPDLLRQLVRTPNAGSGQLARRRSSSIRSAGADAPARPFLDRDWQRAVDGHWRAGSSWTVTRGAGGSDGTRRRTRRALPVMTHAAAARFGRGSRCACASRKRAGARNVRRASNDCADIGDVPNLIPDGATNADSPAVRASSTRRPSSTSAISGWSSGLR